ncbi:MAG: RidA family protein [Myxococcales bacterium]|nr:RidA family protein [Myxococcales bacterium]
MKTPIATSTAPAAIGPYSQAMAAQGSRLLFCSGQIPLDPTTGTLVSGDIDLETRQVLKNLGAVLAAAGLGFDRVVRTTIYLTDLGDFQRVNAVYGEVFANEPPARTTIQVVALPKGARVEIDAIAVG